jgi:hypothetical protein
MHRRYRAVFAALAIVLASACVASPQLAISIWQRDEQALEVRRSRVTAAPEGIRVTGEIHNRGLTFGPVRGHVHIEALGADGHVIRAEDANWPTFGPGGHRSVNYTVVVPVKNLREVAKVTVEPRRRPDGQ